MDYCKKNVTNKEQYKQGRRVLDVVDLSILDFLTGNQDRHNFETFSDFFTFYRNSLDVSFLINLDNGRAFGNPHPPDDMDILAPLTQCCVVRPSTVKTLLKFYDSTETTLAKELQAAMEKADKNQKFGPVLAQKYLIAIDRRHEIVLKEIVKCLNKATSSEDVLMNNMGGKPRFSRQKRIIKQDTLHEKGEKFTRGLTINQMELNDFEIANHEMLDEELTREIITTNNNLDTRTEGHSYNTNRVMTREERNNELARPPTDPDLLEYLQKRLPTDEAAYVQCPNKRTREQRPPRNAIEFTTDPWYEFSAQISNCHLYQKYGDVVKNLIDAMNATTILRAVQVDKKQFAAKLTFHGNNEAIFKPKRFDRNYETDPNHFYLEDFERHHAEIAAFHLDRLLGFRRVPPTVGRKIDAWKDLLEKQNTQGTKRMIFYWSPVNNLCFLSISCPMHCDQSHGYCGNEEIMEGSLQVWSEELNGTIMDSPYKKILSEVDYTIQSHRTNDSYCKNVLKKQHPYNNGRWLLDLVDLHIFYYLTGNQDRDQFNAFNFEHGGIKDSFIFVADNGKAFGNPHQDDKTILAPLTQCCVVRPSTVKTLLEFYDAPQSLGEQLDTSLTEDPLYPILARKYLFAINRRVEVVLKEVETCLRKAGGASKKVFMNFFHNIAWSFFPR